MNKSDPFRDYINFFEKVYTTMEENYYQPVSREAYENFIKKFKEKIYTQVSQQNKSIDFVRWRSAAFLVDDLKSSEDQFSAFYPPQPAKKYEETALGMRVDLGLEGEMEKEGYRLTQAEPRSDAYEKGMRINDVVQEIDAKDVRAISPEDLQNLLNPLVGTKEKIVYWDKKNNERKNIEVVSKEYFKQTVFMVPVRYPGIFCLEIRRFNKKTGEDLLKFLTYIQQNDKLKGLILDLRGNPGGPPLAAREISAFFLPGGDEFAYFQKKGQPKAMLDVPQIQQQYKYDGPIVILINEKSGSASELFSGILQRRKRAVLMGANSAGQVMLKSMFHLDDQSMLLLVTARGHYPDGQVFSFGGLIPDHYFKAEEKDPVHYAATYLEYVNQTPKKFN